MASQLAFVNPELLRWARETAGYSLQQAAELINVNPTKLTAAEAGEAKLTLRQAEEAARQYHRPLATFYLPTPPQEQNAEAAFRQLPDSPPPPWPAAVRLLARRIRQRQADAAEILELLEEAPAWRQVSQRLAQDPLRPADTMRQLLGVTIEEQQKWHDRAGFVPLRSWVDAVENLGVLVIQDGTVPLSILRGVASLHPSVPATVLNTRDDPRARAFTLFHELGHHVRSALAETILEHDEAWCNAFAAQVLMPETFFREDFSERRRDEDALETVDRLALLYGVTPDAAAVRSHTLRLLSDETAEDVRTRIAERGRAAVDQGEEAGGGGNYYLATLSRLSPRFTQLVFAALDNQALTYPDASGILGVKVNNFGRLREEALKRLAAE